MIEQVGGGAIERPILVRDYRPPMGEELRLLFPRGTKPDKGRSYFRREYGYEALAVRFLGGGRLAVGRL
ncbi:MAG: hypothetical protein JXD18_13260 [Anaerolineae bacterium]|nr:hypothetical protein [Anaerolineae bacterium]